MVGTGTAAAHLKRQKAVIQRLSKDLTRRFQMFKRVGVLAMILAGSLAVLQPSVAQARDRDDYRHSDRREYRRDWDRRDYRERRDYRDHEWRERERWERRDYRNNYYSPYVYNPYVNPYCPR